MVCFRECVIEASDAVEPDLECDFCQRDVGVANQTFGHLDPPRGRQFAGRRAKVPLEKTRQVARTHAKFVGQLFDRVLIEIAGLDQSQSASNS